jgi:hypothetical protein
MKWAGYTAAQVAFASRQAQASAGRAGLPQAGASARPPCPAGRGGSTTWGWPSCGVSISPEEENRKPKQLVVGLDPGAGPARQGRRGRRASLYRRGRG